MLNATLSKALRLAEKAEDLNRNRAALVRALRTAREEAEAEQASIEALAWSAGRMHYHRLVREATLRAANRNTKSGGAVR